MRILEKLPPILKNKYLLTVTGFLVWMLFFDDRDFITNYRHHRELQLLEQSRDFYTQQILDTRKELDQLKNQPVTLEKYAREKYRMKKDNEDLFVVPE